MKIAVIGGGAAGLMTTAAILDANPTAEIFLIDRNDGLGKKVIISGGGRCNVTTGILDVRTVLTKYPRGSKFLSSALFQFPPQAVYDWFESHGVPLKTEEDLRVFPKSNKGTDVVGVFERLFKNSNIHVLLKTSVTRIEKHGSGYAIFFKNQTDPLITDKLVLTTGGQAYRHTGSVGDGYAFAISLGHTITKLAPSLNAFFTKETWSAAISGLSFSKAAITANATNKKFTGPFLFTHKGVSGPAVFALSSLIAFETYDPAHPLEISIDLFPDETSIELQEKISTEIQSQPKKSITNIIAHLIPKSLAQIATGALHFSDQRHAIEFGKKEMVTIAEWLKMIPLTVIARGAGDEFVTAGGVTLSEVDPATMESKISPGLYFAGEILDIDGFTGGFNLQASWATGRLAGEHAAKNL